MKNKSKVILTIVCLTCSIIGGGTGFFLGSYFKKGVEVSGSYEIDKVGYNNTQKAAGGDDFSSVDLTTKNVNTCDVVGAAFYKFSYVTKQASSTSFNKALSKSAGIENVQNTFSSYFKIDGSKIMRENVSKAGFVAFAERTYNYDNTKTITTAYEDSYDYYRTTNSSDIQEESNGVNVNYSSSSLQLRHMLKEDFVSMLSSSPEFPFSYKVNNTTMGDSFEINNYHKEKVTFDNSLVLDNDFYVAKISLGENALDNYKKYMVLSLKDGPNIAQMKDLPVFRHVGLQVKMDRNLNLVEMSIIEDYSVITIVGDVPTMAYSKTVFDYSQSKIPSLKDECIDYSKVKDQI